MTSQYTLEELRDLYDLGGEFPYPAGWPHENDNAIIVDYDNIEYIIDMINEENSEYCNAEKYIWYNVDESYELKDVFYDVKEFYDFLLKKYEQLFNENYHEKLRQQEQDIKTKNYIPEYRGGFGNPSNIIYSK